MDKFTVLTDPDIAKHVLPVPKKLYIQEVELARCQVN
jgi:hypothetical protein